MTQFIISVDTLTDALAPVSALVEEAKLQCREGELGIKVVDAANVAMSDVTIDAAAFESYDGGGATLGINLNRLEDVLSMGESGDLVQVTLNEETRKLDLDIGGLSYTLALIDPDSMRNEPDIPDLDLPATIVTEGEQISRGVSAADLCSKHATLQAAADDKTFNINAEGDTDDVSVTIEEDELLSANVDESCESMFSLDYLKDMQRAMPNDAEVSLLLGSEVPVKMRYSLADGDVSVLQMLAPRISSE
jgi:proliferating cell nuclear antigen